jgi:carboxyl-terminal processing protease
VGIIKVNLIAASTPDEIQQAVADLQARGATHYVLDLRDNPGGLLTAGVDIARLFLDEGIVMQQQYRGKDVETYEVKRPGPLNDIPLAVLINHGSASAAEIAAGALQLHRRAPLIGSPSFGKDTIQLVFVLQDDSSLRVTSARWWIPGLEPAVGDAGLQPDIPVTPSDDPNIDTALQAAIQALSLN